MNNDAMMNAAEIMAGTEGEKILFRPAKELPAAIKRVIRDAYIEGYRHGYRENPNYNDEIDNVTL